MLRAEDPVVLMKLATQQDGWTMRSLAADTAIPRSVVHRSIGRLTRAGLLDSAANRVNVSQAEEFLVHGLRYVFPPVQEGVTRGVPTAWAAAPLEGELAPLEELPPVWPAPDGTTRGIALRPLHPAAVEIHRRDPQLAELLALTDAIRLGNPRVRVLAAKLLSSRLHAAATIL